MSNIPRRRLRTPLLLICLMLAGIQVLPACSTREDIPSNPGDPNPDPDPSPNPDPEANEGTVVVAPVPEGAAAPWSLTGPDGYAHNGTGEATLAALPAGQYTVTWQDYPGWGVPNPAQESRTLGSGTTETFVGIYRNLSGPAIDAVSGSMTDGAFVTVSGMDFGSRTGNVQWLGGSNGVIEGLADGTTADGWGPGWKIGLSSSVTPAQISGRRVHSGNKAIWARVDSGVKNSFNSGFAYEPGGTFDEIYVTWWAYFNPIATSGCTSYAPQWKMWRLNATASWNEAFNNYLGEMAMSGNAPVSGPRQNLYVMNWCAPVANYDCTQSYICFPYGYPKGTFDERYLDQDQSGKPYPNDAHRWVRWELYVKASTATDAKNGSFVFRCLIPGQEPWEVDWENKICTHRTLSSTPGVSTWLAWTRFIWQNYWGNCGTDAEWYFDDIYLQTGSRAHVEIGDSPAFECSTQREIQQASTWSDTSIGLVLNRGSFAPGQTVYLYVVREDGSVSSAMPVTLN